jgi:hypothetical protein
MAMGGSSGADVRIAKMLLFGGVVGRGGGVNGRVDFELLRALCGQSCVAFLSLCRDGGL